MPEKNGATIIHGAARPVRGAPSPFAAHCHGRSSPLAAMSSRPARWNLTEGRIFCSRLRNSAPSSSSVSGAIGYVADSVSNVVLWPNRTGFAATRSRSQPSALHVREARTQREIPSDSGTDQAADSLRVARGDRIRSGRGSRKLARDRFRWSEGCSGDGAASGSVLGGLPAALELDGEVDVHAPSFPWCTFPVVSTASGIAASRAPTLSPRETLACSCSADYEQRNVVRTPP